MKIIIHYSDLSKEKLAQIAREVWASSEKIQGYYLHQETFIDDLSTFCDDCLGTISIDTLVKKTTKVIDSRIKIAKEKERVRGQGKF